MKQIISILLLFVTVSAVAQVKVIKVTNTGTDTSSISARIDGKVNVADTSAMLDGYQTAIEGKQDLLSGSGSVGINVSPADPSAQLDIVSSTKGVLIPRNSTSGIAAISSPAKGLMVYDTTKQAFYYFDSARWRPVVGTYKVLFNNTQLSNVGTNTENTVFTGTIPANSIGPNGSFHIIMLDSNSSNANNKVYKVKFNGSTVGQQLNTTTTLSRAYWTISNRNSMTDQVSYANTTNSGATFNGTTSSAAVKTTFDTGADITVTITCQLANTGDRMAVEAFEIIAVY